MEQKTYSPTVFLPHLEISSAPHGIVYSEMYTWVKARSSIVYHATQYSGIVSQICMLYYCNLYVVASQLTLYRLMSLFLHYTVQSNLKLLCGKMNG